MFTKARLAVGALLALGLAGGIAAAAPQTGGDADHEGRRAKMLEKFDTNKNGKLDDSEKAAMKAQFEAKHAEMKAKKLAQFDANKNGKLDDNEKQAMHAQRKIEMFKKLDANGDGKVTQDEFLAAKGPQGRMGPHGHHHRGGGRPQK